MPVCRWLTLAPYCLIDCSAAAVRWPVTTSFRIISKPDRRYHVTGLIVNKLNDTEHFSGTDL